LFYARKQVTNIKGIELDHFLNTGWFRMGNSIFTTQFIFFDEKMYSAIWLKLPLKDFTFKKRHRKLKRKVEKDLKVIYRQAEFNQEKDQLFEVYKKNFKGDIRSSIKTIMLDDSAYNAFNTLEVSIYDDNQLVAFSFFDKGKDNVASILAAYHPDYKHYSLGIYTMLAEVEFCIKNGFKNYFPGYFVPEMNRFDYKYSLGNSKFYHFPNQEWIDFEKFTDKHILSNMLTDNLTLLHEKLRNNRIQNYIFFYRKFELGSYIENYGNVMVHPLMLLISIKNPIVKIEYLFVIEHNLYANNFRILQLSVVDDFKLLQNNSLIEDKVVLIVENNLSSTAVLFESESIEETVLQMKAFEKVIKNLNHEIN